ncbi:hypothetical protein [Vibrio neptunius]|uniref:Uncharacterized protein n=1 Tax=Vibrio neptunius TaxID=170651 RepID=A0ABS3A3K1_9VIBR|nr:hypothetical protein [Vibrio neptunius]MBN3491794.1 hypothetical protein [Vibrio neptunius]MBN3514025.1 hypothetical protein [Vibrio neptunius]MBN3549157.1 hypothetical protein [Vibrio neptunius]MBN3577619.1 hypothetical protein [Vibrio neptunius]MCH9871283.1 hypothetical protein [Vibrio neptunius]
MVQLDIQVVENVFDETVFHITCRSASQPATHSSWKSYANRTHLMTQLANITEAGQWESSVEVFNGWEEAKDRQEKLTSKLLGDGLISLNGRNPRCPVKKAIRKQYSV